MLLGNKPVPVPSSVLLSLMVGFADVLQQTPLAVTEAPPFEVTFPPLDALVEVIEDTSRCGDCWGRCGCGESYIAAICCPRTVCGVGPYMIGGIGKKADHAAGEGPGSSGRTFIGMAA